MSLPLNAGSRLEGPEAWERGKNSVRVSGVCARKGGEGDVTRLPAKGTTKMGVCKQMNRATTM